jgi:hypothetical protein
VVDYEAFDDMPASGGDAFPAPVSSARAARPPSLKAPAMGGLARGTRVFHRRFGSGIVEETEGPDKVVARFKGFGPKKVLLEYLTLKE